MKYCTAGEKEGERNGDKIWDVWTGNSELYSWASMDRSARCRDACGCEDVCS